MAEHGGEGGVELVEGGFGEGGVVHLLDDGGAAIEHLGVEIELESVEMAPLSVLVLLAELGFFGAPFFEGFGRDFQFFGGVREVAVELVKFVEGVDF